MTTKYAFDGDNGNVRYLTGKLSSISYRESEKQPADLVYNVDDVQVVADLDYRDSFNRPFGQMSLAVRTHLAAVKIEDDTYFVLDNEGLNHETSVANNGGSKRLVGGRTHTYHISNGEMKLAMTAGAYDDFDKFNLELNKSLIGTQYSVAGSVSFTKQVVKTNDADKTYVQIDSVEEPAVLDENAPSNLGLLFLSGVTKVQAEYERRSDLRELSDKERAAALAKANVRANDISYNREDVGHELDFEDTSRNNFYVAPTDARKADEEKQVDPTSDARLSVGGRSAGEGRAMSYNPDADDDLDF